MEPTTKPCPKCRASGGDRTGNNLTTFPDGGSYCFACKEVGKPSWMVKGKLASQRRGISDEVFRFMNYRIGQYTGSVKDRKTNQYRDAVKEKCHVITWLDQRTRQPYRQQLRFSDKAFKTLGDKNHDLDLYGITDYTPTDKLFCVITEGAIDRGSVITVMGIQYPVVSLPNGAASAVKTLKKNYDWLLQWKYIVLAYDADKDGQNAQIESSKLFEPDKIRLCNWPSGFKDANEMLQAGEGEAMKRAIWNAQTPAMENIVTAGDLIDELGEAPQFGIDLPWQSMNDIMYGLRMCEITTFVGPTGCGKTEIIKDIVSSLLDRMNVAVFSFEQKPKETLRRYIGAQLGLKLQKPGTEYPVEKIKKIGLSYDNKLFLYKVTGRVTAKDILRNIVYVAKAKGCKLIIIDNLKFLRVVMDKEACAEFAQTLKELVESLEIHIFLVSHVSKNTIRRSTHVGFSSLIPKGGKPHENLSEEEVKSTMNKFALDWEDGRQPGESDIEGGNDIAAVSDYIFSLGRNKRSLIDTVRRTINVVPLKYGRIDDEYAKNIFKLYREDSGKLLEIDYTLNNGDDTFDEEDLNE